ncbi:sialidase family protein [Fontisphaera persica]|uniref:sialidase family protein n=1 Tax=Fontisphaera persica TaxID=2974023 RepID=UPI0024C0C881|nr:sialidase family protein [Fontisphaera persica]WCJ59807.1 sialidase family protein [Fontisphaera persica]
MKHSSNPHRRASWLFQSCLAGILWHLVCCCPSAPAAEAASTPLLRVPVFTSGQDGYHTYRIPALLRAANGDLLALAEGRRHGAGDAGDIDLVLKRSADGGRTWSSLQVVWDDSTNTCGNPCPVVERETGRIVLLMTWNRGEDRESQIINQTSKDTRRVFVTHSDDHGRTWSPPREITAQVKPTNWTWFATGPGAGIQLEKGVHRGRLVIPCDHIEAGAKRYYSHVIYSDDRGQIWKLGGRTPQPAVNECEVAELSDGRLMLNMRNYNRANPTRQVAFSADGGLTWTDQRHVPELIEPICQASLRRIAWPEGQNPGALLFSNPASTNRRERLTVRLSEDDGRTWPRAQVVDPRPAAYSCLAAISPTEAAVLYEAGEKNPYEAIWLARLPLTWLKTGTPRP